METALGAFGLCMVSALIAVGIQCFLDKAFDAMESFLDKDRTH